MRRVVHFYRYREIETQTVLILTRFIMKGDITFVTHYKFMKVVLKLSNQIAKLKILSQDFILNV